MPIMELGVLEIGLKNGQISNVNAFLRIHSEGYKTKMVETCEKHAFEWTDIRKMMADWIHVFDLIVDVLSNRLHKLASSNDCEFGRKLARIALAVTAQLIGQTLKYLSQRANHQDANDFCHKLNVHNIRIRNLLDGPLQQTSQKQFVKQNSLHVETHADFGTEKGETCLSESDRQKQYEQFLFNEIPQPVCDWNEVNKYGGDKLLQAIAKKNYQLAKKIVARFALPRQATFEYLLLNSFRFDVQRCLCNVFGYDYDTAQPVISIDAELERAEWIRPLLAKHLDLRRRFSDRPVNASFEAIRSVDTELWNLLLATKKIQEISKSDLLIQAKLAAITNDLPYMINLIEKQIVSDRPSSKYIQKLIESLPLWPEASRHKIRHFLCDRNIYLSNKSRANQVMRLKYMAATKNRQDLHLIGRDSDSDFFGQQFSIDLMKFMVAERLHEILYWYLRLNPKHVRQFRDLIGIEEYVQKLHLSLLNYDLEFDHSKPQATLGLLLETTSYLRSATESILGTGDMNDLSAQNRPVETFVSWFLMSGQESLGNSKTNQQFVRYNCSIYPIMTRSFEQVETDSTYGKRCDRIPNLYEMLQHALMFDVERLFTWQRNNVLVNRALDTPRRIPHFGRCELSALYGLRAQLSYLYFLTRGRPQEAYVELMRSIQDEPDHVRQKRLQSAIRKSTSFALQNSHCGSIALACVQLLRLLRADIANLLLHLKVGTLIATHAREYLGLETAQQFRQLGKLLNQLHLRRDRSVATRTFELLQIALDRRHQTSVGRSGSFSFADCPTTTSATGHDLPELFELNENQLLIQQLFEQKLLVEFARLHLLAPPLEFVRRCIRVNHWLLVTVYAQLYDLPPNVLVGLLEHNQIRNSDNSCVLDHLIKAFNPKRIYAISERSKTIGQSERKNQTQRLRASLYNRVGVRRSFLELNTLGVSPTDLTSVLLPHRLNQQSSQGTSPTNDETGSTSNVAAVVGTTNNCNTSVQPEEGDVAIDFDLPPADIESMFGDTCSVVSGSPSVDMTLDYWRSLAAQTITSGESSGNQSCTASNNENDAQLVRMIQNKTLPIKRLKSLFDILLLCERPQIETMQAALLNSTILLRNPIGALFANSVTMISRPYTTINGSLRLDCFCCWYRATVRLYMPHLDRNSKHLRIKWMPKEWLSLLSDSLGSIKAVQAFGIGLHVFGVSPTNPLHYLTAFIVDFRLDKNHHESVDKLRRFVELFQQHQDSAGRGSPPFDHLSDDLNKSPDYGLFESSFWINEIASLLIDCSLNAIHRPYELIAILEHLDSCEIGRRWLVRGRLKHIPQYRKLIVLLHESHLCELIFELMQSHVSSNEFKRILNKAIATLQAKHDFDKAREVAALFDLDREQLLFNEFTIKAQLNGDHFDFWLECLQILGSSQLSNESLIDFLSRFKKRCESLATICLLTANLVMQQFQLIPQDVSQCLASLSELVHFLTRFAQQDESKEIGERSSINRWDKLNEVLEGIGIYLENEGATLKMIQAELKKELGHSKSSMPVHMNPVITGLLNRGCLRLGQIFCDILKCVWPDNLFKLIECEQSIETYLKQSIDVPLLNESKSTQSFSSNEAAMFQLHHLSISINDCDQQLLVFRLSILLRKPWLTIKSELNSLTLLERLIAVFPHKPEVIHEIRQLIALNRWTDQQLVQFICSDLDRLLRTGALTKPTDEEEEDEEEENDEENEEDEDAAEVLYSDEIEKDETNEVEDSCEARTTSRRPVASFHQRLNESVHKAKKSSTEQFLLFARLLSNSSILGQELLQQAQAAIKSERETVELCVKAHECFSLSSDVEGISSTLTFARRLVSQRLQPAKAYDPMLRLLIGIGRYSEMRYVFEWLRSEGQLKRLFDRKRTVSSAALQLALLDTFKNDREMLGQIAIHFHMHREIGQLLESQALRSIPLGAPLVTLLYGLNLGRDWCAITNPAETGSSTTTTTSSTSTDPIPIGKSIDGASTIFSNPEPGSSSLRNNLTSFGRRNVQRAAKSLSRFEVQLPDSSSAVGSAPTFRDSRTERDQCERALNFLLDAFEKYEQGGCFNRASRCERLAQLIALRLRTLQTSGTNSSSVHRNVLTMTVQQAESWIAGHAQFQESWLMAQLYSPSFDWSSALYNRVLIAGDWQYYRDFCTRLSLNTIICTRLSQKVNECKPGNKSVTTDRYTIIRNNWLKLITLITDVRLVYRLALEHGFVSVSSNLLESSSCGSGAFLTDLRRLGKL